LKTPLLPKVGNDSDPLIAGARRRNADLERRSCGKGRIDSSPGRDTWTGADFLSIHDVKVFEGPGERSLRSRKQSGRVRVIRRIRVPAVGQHLAPIGRQ